MQLRFELPTTGDMVATAAVVRWVRDRAHSKHAPCAIAFQFHNPPNALKSAINSYIALMARG